MKKRIVSLLLCLIMALSLIPTTAFATEVPNADNTPEVQAATNKIAVQGGWNGGTDYSKVINWKQFYGYTSDKYMSSVADDTEGKCTVYYGTTQWTGFVDKDSTIRKDGITIKPATGYYVKQVVIACDDQGGYRCQTAHRDGIVKFGNSSTQSADFVIPAENLANNKYIGNNPVWHSGAGYPNHLMIWLAKSPNPAEVIYDAGNMSDVLSGKTLIAYDSAEEQPAGVNMELGYPQVAANKITYQYNRETSTAQPQHTILDMLDTFKTVKGSDGKTYAFTGWRAYSSVDAAGSESWNPVTGSSAVGDKLTLYANYKLVAQWEEVEITTGSLTITKVVSAPEGVTVPDSFTFNVSGYSEPVTVTAADNWTKTITVNAGTYTVTENTSTVPGGYKLDTTYAPENGTVTVTAGGSAEVTVTNTYTKVFGADIVNPASLTVFKKDARTDALLSGAEFQLLKKVGNDYVAVGIPVGTTSSGMITFTALEPGDYQLKETKAPANYVGWTDHTFAFTVVKNDEPTDAARYNETTKQFEKVYDCHIVLTSDLDEGFQDFYKNYSFANNELTVYNEKIGGKEIEVKKIVKAPYAPVGETEFTFYVTLGYDNNTSVFEDVDLLSDFHIYFKAKGADTATELTFDDVENRYSFTMKASSDEIGEGTLILTGTRNDLDRLAVSVWEDEDEAPENWEYADEPCVAILTYDKESNDYLLLNEDEEPVTVPFTFTNTYTKVVTDVTAKFNVEKVVERQRGSRKPGKADFTFEAYYTDANGKLVKIDQDLTISTWGVGKYGASWDLVVPAAAFNDNGVASLTVKEVNGKKSGWTYDKTTYELIVTRDGKVSFPTKPLANAETDSAAALTVTFTNSYYKHSFNGGDDKPIKSVKTGDMGIAMYAMTSLLSLGGAALVIKKRKDEE